MNNTQRLIELEHSLRNSIVKIKKEIVDTNFKTKIAKDEIVRISIVTADELNIEHFVIKLEVQRFGKENEIITDYQYLNIDLFIKYVKEQYIIL